MERFAFVIHPLDVSDVARKFPFVRFLPDRWVERMLLLLPPVKVSHITGVRSPYAEAEGWFVSCPLTARQIMSLPPEYVLEKIVQAGKLAEKLGAKILGLGAFTKVVGDAGVTVARRLNIPVTTGNSYTVATAVEATKEAARLMGYQLEEAAVAVIGATGAIGSVCAELLAREAQDLTLVGRNLERLRNLAERIRHRTGLAVKITDDLKGALRRADVVLTVTSAVEAIIEPEDLKPGAVVCDVARPRDVSRRVAVERPDVLVIEGGVVEVPGEVNFNFNFGFPPRMAYACMAETMILALEGRYESYTLGRDLTVEQVEEIARLAHKHGFKLAGFRSFERALTPEDIERVREHAHRKRKAV
ncbi:NAD(P)H-binding protein [Ammonifex thiophilus]|uniref:Shikimate dehydrogenase n=1 Tax=Ammonifex thiophilus TaxID=444093 RepID=A0A3D8P4I6_9THEO|nr:NAD(P)H-binding protein [Ammonifex thiophilus]RDV82562.1 shikimate dehydrogenase [Ammonifex thiophilus]